MDTVTNIHAPAPQADEAVQNRTSKLFRALAFTALVSATALDDEWEVRLSFGGPREGEFCRYITATEARELAAALTAAADHYDAETARLAQEA